MNLRPWMGKIAHLNLPTVDSRVVRYLSIRHSAPVVSERLRMPVGRLLEVRYSGDEVFGVGWMSAEDLPDTYFPSTIPCGIDVDAAEVEEDSNPLIIVRGRLSAITIYDGDGRSKPAWPDCRVMLL